MTHDLDDFALWIEYGITSGYCGPIVCFDHDGIPTTSAEDEVIEEYGEICIPIVRVYADRATAKGVEANHAPSMWRR
ncbi:MAG: hypothetical protein ACO3O7_05700 [Ilumatobacteraceae bacterium]